MKHFREIYGLSLLGSIVGLAAIIALGKVEQQTSFGLTNVLSILGTLGGAFAQWAFSKRD